MPHVAAAVSLGRNGVDAAMNPAVQKAHISLAG